MIGSNRTSTIPSFARWVAHEITFPGLGTELGLLFLRYHCETASAPNPKMRYIRFVTVEHLEWGDTVGKCTC